jgi:hypothetical protein
MSSFGESSVWSKNLGPLNKSLKGKGSTRMSQENQQDTISKRIVVRQVPGEDDVVIRRDVKYRVTDDGALTMDVYYPPGSKSGSRIPAVVYVFG